MLVTAVPERDASARFFLLGVSEESSAAVGAAGAAVGKLVKLACDIRPMKVLACSSAELTAHIAVMGSLADSISSIEISVSSSTQHNTAVSTHNQDIQSRTIVSTQSLPPRRTEVEV